MAATTLVTFLFDCPSAATSVALLGSWDNFSKPYHLQRDKRRGIKSWTGCFSFDSIICDGDFEGPSIKRTGPLLMGGTYWYYYKVDDDEEHHNPSQPSTTFCPLLPGQRLNILDVPMESASKTSPDSFHAFTRNPNDKYLTPVPPKTLPSPRLGDYCRETYKVPMHPGRELRAYTTPSQGQYRFNRTERRGRSISASQASPSGSTFPDLKGLKDMIVSSKRSAPNSRGHSPQRRGKGLEIGAPVLISTTAEDVYLVPLPSATTPERSPLTPSHISAKLREFSPLGSNPVDPVRDLGITIPQTSPVISEYGRPKRAQSHITSPVSNDVEANSGRTRANSSDIRRTRVYVYSNEPWVSSPKLPSEPECLEEPAPVLPKPLAPLQIPRSSMNERPSSRHGSKMNTPVCSTPLDKELPALPRYLVPAPLFACSAASSPVCPPEAEHKEDVDGEEAPVIPLAMRRSHFSTWSSNSTTSDKVADEDDAAYSPTFSSSTSNSSVPNSPQQPSAVSTDANDQLKVEARDVSNVEQQDEGVTRRSARGSMGPPLLRLSTLSFGSSLLPPVIHHEPTSPRRQASCIGYSGFQGYSLPEDDTCSQSTLLKETLSLEPVIASNRCSSTSQLEKMVNDFGYLSGSVL
ncbi:hypothetical protein BU24DRAFT_47940 [Aaosphaeria arxii CBS 175.79]|uniref:Uncharacterized protein n=1 Tax=Aaosphaeria arxii CBS 175.79 TaxID=1450172 RepID=A0A6A5XDI3_9PLEO|nr:uncharacterized protein BU24DRAFT_47940 [Aaosphaeria arxii CBS 175.79]KAF2010876.1 hypothetical protein BU24DRAFT_47940 [Aaosphaeria arxii CBS 175.79]